MTYPLFPIEQKDYTYIGQCNCNANSLYQNNSGDGSNSTDPAHRRPYKVIDYVCGFNGGQEALRKQSEKRREKGATFD